MDDKYLKDLEQYTKDREALSNNMSKCCDDLISSIMKVKDDKLFREIMEKLKLYQNSFFDYTRIMIHSVEEWAKLKEQK